MATAYRFTPDVKEILERFREEECFNDGKENFFACLFSDGVRHWLPESLALKAIDLLSQGIDVVAIQNDGKNYISSVIDASTLGFNVSIKG